MASEMEIFKFIWKIENYNYVPCYRGRFLKSPEFNVKNLGSTYLELYPKGDVLDPDHDSLIVNLKYCAKFMHTTISCDVEMLWRDEKAKFIVEEVYDNTKWRCKGEKRNNILIDYAKPNQDSVKDIDEFERGTLVVTCCFYEKLSDNSMHMTKDLDALSKDLESVYVNRQFSDLTLRAGIEEFHVHKVIICARIPKLYAQLYNKNKDKSNDKEMISQYTTLDMEPSVLRMLLNYVYAGKMKSSVDIPPDLYKVAELYEMMDLKEKLCTSPNQITARTFIQIDRNLFKWQFKNLYKLEVKQSLYSPAFSGGSVPCSDLKMECFIQQAYPKEILREKFLIRIHRLFKGDSIYVKCRISVEELPYLKKVADFVFSSDEVWEFPSFIEILRDKPLLHVVGSVTTVDTMLTGFTLKCEFHVSGSIPEALVETECTTAQFESFDAQGSNLTNLSDDLGSMYNIFSPKMSDVAFQVNNVKFPAHKVILAARSPVFARMLELDMLERANGIIKVDDIDITTLNLLLKYMYFGKVELLNYDNVAKLYSVADKYEVISLKELCTQHLKSILSLINVCDILVLADMHSDIILKKFVIDFICAHANVILELSEWKELIDLRVKLASEVLYYISDALLTRMNGNCALRERNVTVARRVNPLIKIYRQAQ